MQLLMNPRYRVKWVHQVFQVILDLPVKVHQVHKVHKVPKVVAWFTKYFNKFFSKFI